MIQYKMDLTMVEQEIIELADEMASAMSDLNAHNYKNFVDARDRFRAKLKDMSDTTIKNYEKIERMKKAISEL